MIFNFSTPWGRRNFLLLVWTGLLGALPMPGARSDAFREPENWGEAKRSAPDALIRPVAQTGHIHPAWEGENIINLDAIGQEINIETDRGKPAVFEVLIRKSGVSDEVLIWADEPSAGWKAKYFLGKQEITENITQNGWHHKFLSDEDVKIRVEVLSPVDNAGQKARQRFVLHAKNLIFNGVINEDVVGANVVAHGKVDLSIGKPDLLLQLAWEEDFVGEGVFHPDGANQKKAATIPFGNPQSYFIKVVNRGPVAGPLQLQGAGGKAGWTVKYFDAISGKNEITAQMMGEGWQTPSLSLGESLSLRVDLTPTLAARSDQEFLVTVATPSPQNGQQQITDGVKAQGVLPQFIQKLQYRTDAMAIEEWQEIPPNSVIEVQQGLSVGFRAVKGKPDLKWPTEPSMKPVWVDLSKNNGWNLGETIYTQFEKANTATGLYVVKADCGTEVSVQVRVVNFLKNRLWAKSEYLTLEKEPPPDTIIDNGLGVKVVKKEIMQPKSTPVGVRITDSNRKPVPGIKVQFSKTGGSGEINGPGIADDFAVTDARGNASVTLTSGKTAGVVHIVAKIEDVPETMRLGELNEIDVTLAEPSYEWVEVEPIEGVPAGP